MCEEYPIISYLIFAQCVLGVLETVQLPYCGAKSVPRLCIPSETVHDSVHDSWHTGFKLDSRKNTTGAYFPARLLVKFPMCGLFRETNDLHPPLSS